MVKLARPTTAAHAAVAAATLGVGALTFAGVLGQSHDEHFDAKRVVVSPAGGDGLRIHETIDIDFGRNQRHGYERRIPNDFGEPTDVEASSPDAPDRVATTLLGTRTRVRVGDPRITISGRHRYELSYTYPEAGIRGERLALDIIGTDETFRTDRFEVIVTEFELANPECHVGPRGAVGNCELHDDGEVYRVVFEPLAPGEGITIAGDIVGARPVATLDAPATVADPPSTVPLTIATLAVGGLTGGGIYRLARRRGRNEVAAGGAADAAYGISGLRPTQPTDELPPPEGFERPGQSSPPAPPSVPSNLPPPSGPPETPPVQLLHDDELAALATIEFVPPQGVAPWLGRVLLVEAFDETLVASWLSDLATREIVQVDDDAGKVTLSFGPRFDDAAPEDQASLRAMLGTTGRRQLGTYSKRFAAEWNRVAARQRKFVAQSGLWRRPLANAAMTAVTTALTGLMLAGVLVLVLFGTKIPTLGPLSTAPGAVLAAVALPALIAFGAYARLLPARTAAGSALALRTESFRRFLAASEARHVEWAWSHGLMREYSTWAVALGAAKTWEAAAKASTVPPTELNAIAPLVLYHNSAKLQSAHTAPSSSGGSGGGGFSGGSVGGGGGGGSSGSW